MHDDVLERLFGDLAGADVPVPAPAVVVARGRQRRRRARGQLAGGTVATVALLGLAVTELTGSLTPAHPPAAHPASASAVCPAAPDPALAAELQHALPATRYLGLTPIALSANGSTAYVLTTTEGFHGIVEESPVTGEISRKIVSLPPAVNGAVGGLGPDGDLVWASTLDGMFSGPFRVWSPRTGQLTVLEPAGHSGAALSAPTFGGPSNQLVAWVQDAGSKREIVEANLVTRTASVIATGYIGPPVFVGKSLVWSVADGPGRLPARVAARNAAEFPAQQKTGIPAALRGVSPSVLGGQPPPGSPPAREISLIVSYGGALAYLSAPGASGALTELYYSPSPSQRVRMVLRLSGTNSFAPGSLALGAGFLGWSLASAASYVASTSSLAAAMLTDGSADYGSVQAAGRFVIAASSSDPNQVVSRLSVLSGTTIERLTCATARAAGH